MQEEQEGSLDKPGAKRRTTNEVCPQGEHSESINKIDKIGGAKRRRTNEVCPQGDQSKSIVGAKKK